MADVDAQLVEQAVPVVVAHVGQQPPPRALFRPEIARRAIGRLVVQGFLDSLAGRHSGDLPYHLKFSALWLGLLYGQADIVEEQRDRRPAAVRLQEQDEAA